MVFGKTRRILPILCSQLIVFGIFSLHSILITRKGDGNHLSHGQRPLWYIDRCFYHCILVGLKRNPTSNDSMEAENMIYALAVLVYLAANYLFATLMNNIAVEKGYENSHAFALVFFFGILGMLYVIALPNLKTQSQLEDILTLLLERNAEK